MPKDYDRILEAWSKKWKEENLTDEVRKLINQANFDLYYGPINDGAIGDPAEDDEELKKYPGFSKAVAIIIKALDDLPSDLYLETETGFVSESEPQPEKCQTCDGEGTVGDDDPTHRQVREDRCTDCDGRGCFDTTGDWWHVERRDILIAILGKELSSYVRR
jgi:hypothetical protein